MPDSTMYPKNYNNYPMPDIPSFGTHGNISLLLAQKLRGLMPQIPSFSPQMSMAAAQNLARQGQPSNPHPTPPPAPPAAPPPATAASAPMQELGPTPEPFTPPTVRAEGMAPPELHTVPEDGAGVSGDGSIWDNPEALEQILGMEGINRQLSYAEKLREMESPEGRYTGGGRLYTAANPIEHLGTLAARLRGKHDVKKYSGELEDSRKKLLEFLRNK